MEAGDDARALQVPHERLVRRLTKLLRARQRPVLALCACASPVLRARVERELRARLAGRAVVPGDLTGAHDPWTELVDARDAAGASLDAVLSFGLPPGDRPEVEVGVLDRLNFGREFITRESLRIVLWASGLAQEERLRRGAPDLWVHRSEALVFLTAEEFALPPPSDEPRALEVALRKIDDALARETVVGREREALHVMRAIFRYTAGAAPGDEPAGVGPEARALARHLGLTHDALGASDATALRAAFADTSSGDAPPPELGPLVRGALPWVRGHAVDPASLAAETAASLRMWASGADLPAFVLRSLRLNTLPMEALAGRHRTVLQQDVSFDPPHDAPSEAAALLWLGVWPAAIMARARSLRGVGQAITALRELHTLLRGLAAMGAARPLTQLVEQLVRIYVDMGLPGEARRVLDLTDRDDLRPPGAESDLLWTHLRALACRAEGEGGEARGLVDAATARLAGGALDALAAPVRLARELDLLQLRAEFDPALEVTGPLAALRRSAQDAALEDLALSVADALRGHRMRRERFDDALATCRDALGSLNDAWGPSAHARWRVYAAEALLALDRPAEALAESDLALARWAVDPPLLRSLPLRAAVAVVRARSLAALARGDDALRELREAVALLREEDARVAVAELLNALAELPLPDGHLLDRRAAAREALELARDAMHLAVEARAMLNLASLSAPDAPATRAMLDEALWLARGSGDEETLRHADEVAAAHARRVRAP